MDTQKRALMGMTLPELKQAIIEFGMPGFTAKQLAQWLYVHPVRNFDGMTNLSIKHRGLLEEHFVVGSNHPVERQRSADGTIKYLYRTTEGNYVETVYIPESNRATLCVSSQVGCKMNCLFCMTGKQGFSGNLSATDILNQLYALPEREKITNLVFMGQGEPFDNLDNVLQAIEILTADYGLAWSPKRITVSSVGLKKGLKRYLEESDCHLAISMHCADLKKRAEMMPAEKDFSIAEVVKLIKQYDFSHQRRVSFEYIVFAGVNDSTDDARKIIQLLKGLDCRVNLIRFHRIPNLDLQGADEEKMQQFRDYLTSHGVFTTIRASRGEDIFAACGLLSTAKQQSEKENR